MTRSWTFRILTLCLLGPVLCAAEGVNCDGAGTQLCKNVGGGNGMGDIQTAMQNAIKAGRGGNFYNTGTQIACRCHASGSQICAFFQMNNAQGNLSFASDLVASIQQHGCTDCGSTPTDRPNNDVSKGELTVNFVSSAPCCGGVSADTAVVCSPDSVTSPSSPPASPPPPPPSTSSPPASPPASTPASAPASASSSGPSDPAPSCDLDGTDPEPFDDDPDPTSSSSSSMPTSASGTGQTPGPTTGPGGNPTSSPTTGPGPGPGPGPGQSPSPTNTPKPSGSSTPGGGSSGGSGPGGTGGKPFGPSSGTPNPNCDTGTPIRGPTGAGSWGLRNQDGGCDNDANPHPYGGYGNTPLSCYNFNTTEVWNHIALTRTGGMQIQLYANQDCDPCGGCSVWNSATHYADTQACVTNIGSYSGNFFTRSFMIVQNGTAPGTCKVID